VERLPRRFFHLAAAFLLVVSFRESWFVKSPVAMVMKLRTMKTVICSSVVAIKIKEGFEMSLEALKRLIQGRCVFCKERLPKGYQKEYCKKCGRTHSDEIRRLERQVKDLGF
jgi:hypothetical protein